MRPFLPLLLPLLLLSGCWCEEMYCVTGLEGDVELRGFAPDELRSVRWLTLDDVTPIDSGQVAGFAGDSTVSFSTAAWTPDQQCIIRLDSADRTIVIDGYRTETFECNDCGLFARDEQERLSEYRVDGVWVAGPRMVVRP